MALLVSNLPAGNEGTRLACACGAALDVAGRPEIVAALAADWHARHDPAKPGQGPTTRPPSQDGRAPRRPR